MSEKKGNSIWFLVVLVVLIGILPLLMWGPWGGHMLGGMGMMGYGWGFMFLVPILFLVLIALGAYFLITWFAGAGKLASRRGERSLEILKERYARGEITGEQYLKMKEELET